MSIQTAIQFIRSVRENDELARAVAALGPSATLGDLLAISSQAGFAFTEAEMRSAHAHDWSMRWFRYEQQDS